MLSACAKLPLELEPQLPRPPGLASSFSHSMSLHVPLHVVLHVTSLWLLGHRGLLALDGDARFAAGARRHRTRLPDDLPGGTEKAETG